MPGRYTSVTKVTVDNNGQMLCGPNPHRRYLQISLNGGTALFVNFGGAATAYQDFCINNGQESESFDYHKMGNLLTGGIFGIIPGAAASVVVVEGLLPRPDNNAPAYGGKHMRRWSVYSTPTIATTSGQLVGSNPHRRYLRIANPGTGANFFLSFGATAVLNKDFIVNQFVHSEEFTYETMGNLITGQVNAICSGGSATPAAVIEGMLEETADEHTIGASEAPFGMS